MRFSSLVEARYISSSQCIWHDCFLDSTRKPGKSFLSCFWYADDIGLGLLFYHITRALSSFTFILFPPSATPRFLLPSVLRFFPFPSFLTTLRLGAKASPKHRLPLGNPQSCSRLFEALALAISEATVLKMSWEVAGTMCEGDAVGGGGGGVEEGRSEGRDLRMVRGGFDGWKFWVGEA